MKLITAALLAIFVAAPVTRASARPRGPFTDGEIEVLVGGRPAPHYFRAGEHHVLARKGDRYTLRVWNRSPVRVEAVVSVDGRDVLDGQAADYRSKRGYVIAGNGYLDIDGWRLGPDEVAAFRFADNKDAYAARAGASADLGVIGVAFFPAAERVVVKLPWWPRPPRPPWRLDAAPPIARVAAPTTPPPAPPSGLGTEFGERHTSPVREVAFTRLDPQEPAQIFVLRYNDRAGLRALGIDVDVRDPGPMAEELQRRRTANPFPNATRVYASPPAGWKR